MRATIDELETGARDEYLACSLPRAFPIGYVYALTLSHDILSWEGGNDMSGIKDIPVGKLVALQFADPSEFRRAARFVAENKIRADAPGRSTLFVRISDRHLFEARGFKCREFKIADPEQVSSKTLSRLRLAGTKW